MSSKREKDADATLLAHSAAFTEFLNKSKDIESDRHANSSRTKKAREKLLKLSSVQFVELSTDVYDELQRRQRRDSEAYLSANLQFHPKRNEARKKLASLPPSRFKDLVTDMLFETGRREPEALEKPKHGKTAELDNGNAAHVGILAGTVIPTKSTLAWSSDEEEEEEEEEAEEPPAQDRSFGLRNAEHSIIKLHNKKNSDSSIEYHQNESIKSPSRSIQSPHKPGYHERGMSGMHSFGSPTPNRASGQDLSSKDREIELLLAEGDKMDKAISLHEKTIKELQTHIQQLEHEKAHLHETHQNHLQKTEEVEQDLVSSRQHIAQLEKELQRGDSDGKVAELQQQVSKLSFTVKNLEREKDANEKAYLELRSKSEGTEREYKLILDDYKVLQEKYNAALLTEDQVKDGFKDERKKTLTKLKQLEEENNNLMKKLDSVEQTKAEFEYEKQSLKKQLEAEKLEKQHLLQQLNAEKLKNPPPIISEKALVKDLNSSDSINKLGKIEERLHKVNAKEVNDNDETIEGLKLQILDWQKKYQDLRSETLKQTMTSGINSSLNTIKHTDLSEAAIEKYMDPAGLISVKSVVDLNSLISSFLLIINDDNISTDILFETITKITIIAGNIASEGETINSGEFSALIKASVSHAITSTRFYAVHGKTLPKLVVETAVSEISFSVCNLIAAAKANRSSPGATVFLKDPRNLTVNQRSLSLSTDNTVVNESEESVLNVRPLRMAKKNGLALSPIITTKRENPFTTNFSLSPNVIGKPNGRFAPFTGDGSNNSSAKNSPDLFSQSSGSANTTVSETRNEPPMLKSATGIGLKNNGVLPYDSKTVTKRSIVNEYDSGVPPRAGGYAHNGSPKSNFTGVTNNASYMSGSNVYQNTGDSLSQKNGALNNISQSTGNKTTSPARNIGDSPARNTSTNASQNINNSVTRNVSNGLQETSSNVSPGSSFLRNAKDQDTNSYQTNSNPYQSNSTSYRNASLEGTGEPSQSNDNFGYDNSNSNFPHNINSTSTNSSITFLNNTEKASNDSSNNASKKNITTSSSITANSNNSNSGPARNAPHGNSFNTSATSINDTSFSHSTSMDSLQTANHSTPKKSSVSSLKAKFAAESQKDASATTAASKPSVSRNITPTGSILSRMKQLESSLNSGSPLSSPAASPNPVTSQPNKFLQKFESLTGSTNKPALRNNSSVSSFEKKIQSEDFQKPQQQYDPDDLNTEPISRPETPKPSVARLNSVGNNNDQSANSSANVTPKLINYNANGGTPLTIQKPNTEALANNNNTNGMPSPLQETRKSERTVTDFDVNAFDIADPDNTLAELLLYLEHQTVEVISTIQTLLSSIKTPDSTTGTLKEGAKAIGEVVTQMFDATSVSMAQTRNVQLREHGRWVVQSLADCGRRMDMLCSNDKSDDDDYADKHFKQRLAGIAFDIAKCTKELVKTVEEASIKEEIAVIDARLSRSRV